MIECSEKIMHMLRGKYLYDYSLSDSKQKIQLRNMLSIIIYLSTN